MGKKVEPPKEELAPAYFTLYSALWCIMLGFFVMLLSLGNTQMGPGSDGVGQVRDAFGNAGGLGLLPFANNALFGRGDGGASSFRIRKSAPAEVTEMDSYIRGMLWKKGLSNISLISVVKDAGTTKVYLHLPLVFRNNQNLHTESVKVLEMLGEVFLNLSDYTIEVVAVGEEGKDRSALIRDGMKRASVVSRILSDTSGLPPQNICAVGYSDSKLLKANGIDHVKGYVLISIQQDDQ